MIKHVVEIIFVIYEHTRRFLIQKPNTSIMPVAMMYLVFLLYVLPMNSHIHTSLYSHRKDTSMKQYLKQFATSKWFDLLGVVLVVGIAISAGYLNSRLEKFVDWGPWTALVPFGLISVINVGISMLSTRFTGQLNKWGNYLGIVNTILSGAIDFILGNKAAIITYPVTFIIYTFAIKKWEASHEGIPNAMNPSQKRLVAGIITIIAFTISGVANYIGFSGHMNFLSILTTIVFAFSLIANFFNALKLDTQWPFWMIYNIVQLLKAFTQGNFANVGKYIFYIVNAMGALLFWKDKEKPTTRS